MPARAAHRLFPSRRRFVPGVEDNLQIWAQSRNSNDTFYSRNWNALCFFMWKKMNEIQGTDGTAEPSKPRNSRNRENSSATTEDTENLRRTQKPRGAKCLQNKQEPQNE